jgi:ubiquinone/menaquinone biosynthesis C-methylase UbiE
MVKDLFSQQAHCYATFRPSYPAELVEFILTYVQNREAAWDCATGNGQAARMLVPFFQQIVATDISQAQIDQAPPDPKITYRICRAEKTPFADDSFDLTTVAQAYHWFGFDQFAQELIRVSKPGAIVAIWGYSLPEPADPQVKRLLTHFYSETMGRYWDPERKFVDEHYKTVPFPFEEIATPRFSIQQQWKAENLLGYISSWSSLHHFQAAQGYDPTVAFGKRLEEIWQDRSSLSVVFPLFLRLGILRK